MIERNDGPGDAPPATAAEALTGMTREHFLRNSAGGLVTLSSLGALLAACGGNGTSSSGAPTTSASGKPPSAPTGTVALALPGSPPSLDPTRSFSANDLPVTSNLYESLLRYDGELQPSLATSYASNADATKWTFELRQGVKFHDGTDFDAAAVKASIEYHAREESFVAFLVGEPTRIDATDPAKVVVSFKQPFPEFGRYISIVKIISPKLLDGSDRDVARRVNESPSGTGPFRFVRRRGSDVVATAFDGYWGDGPYFKEAHFKVVPDESARASALQAGDVSIVTRVPPPTARGLEGQSQIAVAEGPSLAVLQLSLATARPPFDDLRVRQALMYGIDRQAILDAVFLGKGVITGSPLPPKAYGFAKPATQYAYDPEKAKSLLRAAGHTEPVAFTMSVFSSLMLASSVGQAIAEMANKAGFAAKLDVVDQGVGDKDLVKGNERKYDVVILENGFVAGSALHVNNVTFYSQFEGKELLGQIEKMNSIADGPERVRVMGQVQEIWARELPVLPMWSINFMAALDSSIEGFELPIDGYQPQLASAYATSS